MKALLRKIQLCTGIYCCVKSADDLPCLADGSGHNLKINRIKMSNRCNLSNQCNLSNRCNPNNRRNHESNRNNQLLRHREDLQGVAG